MCTDIHRKTLDLLGKVFDEMLKDVALIQRHDWAIGVVVEMF